MAVVTWIQEHWVVLSAIALAVLRLLESIAIAVKSDSLNKFIETIKEFFRFG